LLSRLDPETARRIHPNDSQKLTRALEVRIMIRSPLPQSEPAEPLRDYRVLKLGLDPARPLLNQRLDARARAMFSSGLLDEVRGLIASGATGEEKPFESINYKQALQHIRGALNFDDAIASMQLETRQYAKRQGTWFRRDPEIRWLKGFGDDPAVRDRALDALQNFYKENF